MLYEHETEVCSFLSTMLNSQYNSVKQTAGNHILFTKLRWPEDSEGLLRSLSQAAACLPQKAEASHCPFRC